LIASIVITVLCLFVRLTHSKPNKQANIQATNVQKQG